MAVEAVENCVNVADFRRLFKRFTEAAAVQHTQSPFMVHITQMHRDSDDRDLTQSPRGSHGDESICFESPEVVAV